MILTQVLTTSATLLRGVLPAPLRDVFPCPRDLVVCPGGLRIDLNGIGGPGTEGAAERLEDLLGALPGIEHAESTAAWAASSWRAIPTPSTRTG